MQMYNVSKRRRNPNKNSPKYVKRNTFSSKKIRKRYGVIAFHQDSETGEFSYIHVGKRYSIGYLELLLGHYQLHDLGLLVRLIEDTTVKEREWILHEDFENLYYNFWGRWDSAHKDNFRMSRKKFETLRQGYSQDNYFFSWDRIIRNAHSQYPQPVKEFPKGRKKRGCKNESDFDCAIREFTEETGLEPTSYVLIPHTKPFVMKFVGMDGCMYENTFYVVKFHNKENLDSRQSSETCGVSWMTFEQALSDLRPHEKEKHDLLQRVHEYLQNMYPMEKQDCNKANCLPG